MVSYIPFYPEIDCHFLLHASASTGIMEEVLSIMKQKLMSSLDAVLIPDVYCRAAGLMR